jgi:lactoylglutathione lyase
MSGPVAELRLALTVSDYDAAVRFYRDALGLPVEQSWDEPNGRGAVLGAGHARIELIDEAQARHIDDVEVGRQVGAPVRIALQVADSAAVARTLTGAGATALAEPTVTPWRHRNVRLAGPEGMQLTLFTVLGDDDAAPPGPL